MVAFDGGLMNARKSFKKDAPYYSSNETFKVNNYTYGVYQDMLQILESQLNFSTELYKRKDEVYGYVYAQPNGSYSATGVVGDVFLKRVDIGVANFAINLERAIYVDFLRPLNPFMIGTYVASDKAMESIDLNTFIAPFTLKLWLVILVMAIFIAIIKMISLYCFGTLNVVDSVGLLWTSLMANIGGTPSSTTIDTTLNYRLTVFISLCCGILIWISYQARLTSELSIIDKNYLFSDWESFSRTNWK